MKLPAHLAHNTAQGIEQGHPIAQFETGTYRNFTYAVLNWTSKEAILIDPHSDLEVVFAGLSSHGFRLVGVVLTHSHWDHIDGLPEIIGQFPSVPLAVHRLELSRIQPEILSQFRVQEIVSSDLQLGEIRLEVIPTPGHSAGECSYVFKTQERGYLFSGDTLFIRDCGRTDLPTGNTSEMYASLQKLKALPLSTVILPGHHYAKETASTLEIELQSSPPLRCASVQELEQLP